MVCSNSVSAALLIHTAVSFGTLKRLRRVGGSAVVFFGGIKNSFLLELDQNALTEILT